MGGSRSGWPRATRRPVAARGRARRILPPLLLPVLLLLGLAACGRTEPVVHIDMLDNFYGRDVTRVPVGAKVTFANDGRVAHNAVAVDQSWRTPESMAAGDEVTITFDRAGSYLFYCTFHATPQGDGMAARLVVGDSAGAYADPDPGAGGTPEPKVAEATGVTRRVPQDHPTIQRAVDAADPGDLVLISPGTYREEVKVRTPSLTLRGTDRNTVVVDGEFVRPNGISVTADGVAVENLTVRNALFNGLFWTGVTGYRSSYVTAYNNEVYN